MIAHSHQQWDISYMIKKLVLQDFHFEAITQLRYLKRLTSFEKLHINMITQSVKLQRHIAA